VAEPVSPGDLARLRALTVSALGAVKEAAELAVELHTRAAAQQHLRRRTLAVLSRIDAAHRSLTVASAGAYPFRDGPPKPDPRPSADGLRLVCAVCSEPIIATPLEEHLFRHRHGDVECGTGDGSTATPRWEVNP
jgi:hypothetical protein